MAFFPSAAEDSIRIELVGGAVERVKRA